ncbi:leucine-rich repeat and calponin homology domain-containing protein 3-like [Notechis scutatus]|uniref:Leucine-rich repeat and calponin homology domain-containing protein 3-like n=1 Tax=Notechis scutatus TaxID=8663 RepID=A0A6J1VVW7_9SAUR|nr:leucine-rich repeat and calponin homology domain-containing protein 3-like [Notechis scutatus]
MLLPIIKPLKELAEYPYSLQRIGGQNDNSRCAPVLHWSEWLRVSLFSLCLFLFNPQSDDRSTISSNSPTSQTVHLSAPYPGPAATPSYRATPQRPESFLFRNSTREEANKAVTSLPASSSAPVNCTDDLSDNHNSTLPEEDILVIEQLRKNIESRLKVSLPNDLSAALTDGVVLCHLANHVRPRSVPSIHVPSPAVPKLTIAKCRRNVENFLEACRKIGVPQV